MSEQSLEDRVNSPTKPKFSWKRFFVDTGANITFATVVGVARDLAIGLDGMQILQTRLTASIIGIPTSRPYGKYRDYVMKKCGVTEYTGAVKKTIIDTAAYISFWIPITAGNYYFAGATLKQNLAGCAIATGLSLFLGRPAGWYLDKVRGLFGVKPEYYTQDDSSTKKK